MTLDLTNDNNKKECFNLKTTDVDKQARFFCQLDTCIYRCYSCEHVASVIEQEG
jgi:hypothetical protein